MPTYVFFFYFGFSNLTYFVFEKVRVEGFGNRFKVIKKQSWENTSIRYEHYA